MNDEYHLYFVAFLNDHNKNVLIPDFWCDGFDLAKSINESLNRNENHLIFHSPNIKNDPDFTLPVRPTLDLNIDGCYFGKIVRAFSKKKSVKFKHS